MVSALCLSGYGPNLHLHYVIREEWPYFISRGVAARGLAPKFPNFFLVGDLLGFWAEWDFLGEMWVIREWMSMILKYGSWYYTLLSTGNSYRGPSGSASRSTED